MISSKYSVLFLSVMLAAASASASEFDGGFVGMDIGQNRSSSSVVAAKNSTYGGLQAGYNWDVGSAIVGLEGFYDLHGNSVTGKDYGLDLKLGLDGGKWLPYLKIGAVGSQPGTRAQGGLGMEYKVSDRLGLLGEWTTDSINKNNVNYKNNNFVIGLNFYFNAPPSPAPVAAPKLAPAPVVAPAPAPVPAAISQPKPEAWKVIRDEKPVTLEGANFASGSAVLLPSANDKLKPVVDFAKKYPQAGIEVHGHTDSVGGDAMNRALSKKRADSVKAELVKNGVDAGRITTKGFGKAEPVADNKTEAGRAKNRRVEVHYTVIEERKVKVQ